MSRYALTHLSDSALLHQLRSLVTQDRATTAPIVAPVGPRMSPSGVSAGTVKFSPAELAASPAPPAPAARVAPLAPQRFAIQCTVSQEIRDKLRHAQELLGHSVPSGDPAQVLDRALDALIAQLERGRFAKTERPRPCRAHNQHEAECAFGRDFMSARRGTTQPVACAPGARTASCT